MFSVNCSQLAAELSLLLSVAEKKTTIPILSCAHFSPQAGHLEITATNLDVTLKTSLEAKATQETAFCVPLKQLHQLVSLLEGNEVEFALKDNGRVKVSQGQSKHLLMAFESGKFPKTDSVPVGTPSGSIPAEKLVTMIKAVKHSMLIDPAAKPSDMRFTGIQFRSADGKLEAQASRKVTLALATCDFNGPEFCAVVPPDAIKALVGFTEGDVAIQCASGFASFTCGQQQLTARLFIDQFPDWSNVVPEFKYSINVDSEALANATSRAIVTTDTNNWERFEALKYTFSQELLSVESRGGDKGKSYEQVPVTSILNGTSVPFGVNGNQILEFLRLTDKTVIELPEEDEPQLVRMRPGEVKDVDYSYVVAGVTLKNWAEG